MNIYYYFYCDVDYINSIQKMASTFTLNILHIYTFFSTCVVISYLIMGNNISIEYNKADTETTEIEQDSKT